MLPMTPSSQICKLITCSVPSTCACEGGIIVAQDRWVSVVMVVDIDPITITFFSRKGNVNAH